MQRVLLASALLIGAACTLYAGAARADIAFGQIVPLTGVDATIGREMSEGAQVYIARVNAEGGVYGQKVAYLVKDNANTPEETLARAAELIKRDQVYGLLPGPNPQHMKALVSSGLLFQHGVPLLAVRNTSTNAPALTNTAEGTTRQAGLIEVAPPADYYAPLINEYREALAKYGQPGATYTGPGLQGYIAAKVMVNAVRLLSAQPTRAQYNEVMHRLMPDTANQLVRTSAPQ
jgi:hypothetical protein